MTHDPEPQPTDGPEFHADHAAWRERNRDRRSLWDTLDTHPKAIIARNHSYSSISQTKKSRAAEMIEEFHTFVGALINDRTEIGDRTLAMRRVSFIEEETQEFREAVLFNDITAIADALADIVYVTYGAAACFGIDLDAVLEEVHRSNMTKSPAGNGKAVKGPGYSKPNIRRVLFNSQK